MKIGVHLASSIVKDYSQNVKTNTEIAANETLKQISTIH